MNTSAKGAAIERRAIAILEAEGYVVHRCIRTGHKRGPIYVSHRNDIFGCIDILAKRPGERMLYVQVTGQRSHAQKVRDLGLVPWDREHEAVEIWRWIPGTGKHKDGRTGAARARSCFRVYSLDDAFVSVRLRQLPAG